MAAPTHLARRALLPATLAFAVVATPAGASVIDPRSPHSPNAHDMVTSYWVMLVVAVLLAVAIHAALLLALVRYRERRQPEPTRIAARRGVVGRAAAGFGVLAAAVLVFGIIETASTRSVESSGPNGLAADAGMLAQVGLRNAPPLTAEPGAPSAPNPETQGEPAQPGGPLVIDAVAQQWLWRFEYPGNNPQALPLFSYGQLVVPVDTTVILNVTSTDVIHTWWVPNLAGQVQAVPGMVAQTWFKADQEGTYSGASTRFAGSSYPALRSWVKVVSAEKYRAYIDRLSADLQKAQGKIERQVQNGTGPIAQVNP